MRTILPEKWYTEVTSDILELAEKWQKSKVPINSTWRTPYVGEFLLYPFLHDNSYFYTRNPSDYNDYSEYEMISSEEFKRLVLGINELPTKWCIEVTKDNFDILTSWQNKVCSPTFIGVIRIGDTLLSKHSDDNSYYYGSGINYLLGDERYADYVEITLEQFKEITNMNSQIIELTREQLISLHDKDSCYDWRNEIKEILNDNLLNVSNKIIIPKKSINLLLCSGSEGQKRIIKEAGVILPKSESELYIENQSKCGLAIGDMVKVVRKSHSGENGWGCNWNLDMDEYVGQVLTITKICGDSGIMLNDKFKFPYFILEKVSSGDKFEVGDLVILSDDSSWKGWTSDGFEYVGEKGKITHNTQYGYCTVKFVNGSYSCRHSSLRKVVEEFEPYSINDDLLGKKIKWKSTNEKMFITYQSSDTIQCGGLTYSYKGLLEDFEYLDGTKCGNLIKK